VTLSERDLAFLAFEHREWRLRGEKDSAMRDEFGLTPTRYYGLLNRLIDRPEAEAAEPVLIHRLRRLRADAIRRKNVGH